ncbi:MAG TPA: response regulator, partial [Azospirillum sp.]
AAAEAVADTTGGGAAGEAKAGAPRRILVVEDDPVQRQGVQLLLESWGHTVTAAADGPAALECLRGAPRPPDAVVTDFRLPGPLTGVQVVTRIGELAGRPVPGIILTGDTAPERIREAVATGCRLLHKPFTPDLLRDALAALGKADVTPARAVRQTAA